MSYWLAANSYLSQALFLILASIGYREMRRHQLGLRAYPKSIENLLLVAITTATYSLYPAFLPLLILALLITQAGYGVAIAEPWRRLLCRGALTLLVPGLTVLLLVLVFRDQAELGEVSRSLNPLLSHASNFVPINPWSLLQEKPKPMPNIRGFGWWFHLSLGLPLSLFGGLLCWRAWRRWRQPDFFVGVMGIAAYGGYLLLFFPLESTYRLMKFNATLLYPLAVWGALPLVLALHRWTMKQSPSTRLVVQLAGGVPYRLSQGRRRKLGHLTWGHRLRTNDHLAPRSRCPDCGLCRRERSYCAVVPPISRALGGAGLGLTSSRARYSCLQLFCG